MNHIKEFFQNTPNCWEQMQQTKLPVILYGMGDGADKVLNQLQRLSVTPAAVIASDGFVRGQSFRGYKVQRLCDAEEAFGQCLIAVSFATQLPEVMNHIKSIAKTRKVIAPSVPVFGDTVFDRNFVNTHIPQLEQAYNLLADDRSRQVFTDVVKFQFTGDLSYLWQTESPKEEIFQSVLPLHNKESYLDLGAYRGDTVQEFLTHTKGQYHTITALEPDGKTFQKLKTYAEPLPRTQLYQLGIWNEETTLLFDNRGGRNSSLNRKKGVPVPVTSVDALIDGKPCTYIKMDVEGAEHQALSGAAYTLSTQKPKLNIAAYHRSKDIFTLPLLIHSLNPGYQIHLRHHPYIPCWDTNYYCV